MSRHDKFNALLSRLHGVATYKIPHTYEGLCQDGSEDSNVRDTDCDACKVLIDVDKYMKERTEDNEKNNEDTV